MIRRQLLNRIEKYAEAYAADLEKGSKLSDDWIEIEQRLRFTKKNLLEAIDKFEETIKKSCS